MPPRGERAVQRPEKPNKSKGSRGLSIFKAVIIVMLVAVIGLGSYAGYLWLKFRDTVDVIGTDEDVPQQEKANERPLSLLILGTDYREATRSANTDVIMIATLNPNSKTATLVSIPRDTKIDPEGLKPNKANSFYATYLYGKLSSAPQDKDERQKYAMDQIKQMFGEYLGIPIDYVSVVTFKTFEDVVDAYGGLTIDVDQNMCHIDNADGTRIDLKKGTQHLDGGKTLDFVRYRESHNCSPKTKPSNDFERNTRQQQVISKLFAKMKTPDGVLKLGKVFDAVGDNVKTDIPSQQIDAMIKTYIGIDNDKINYIHLEGKWDGKYVNIPQEQLDLAKTGLQSQLNPDGPAPDESVTDTETDAGADEASGT